MTHASDSNPSAWSARLLVFGLALVGCAVASYLALYQWHVTTSVWDQVLGATSSEAVLGSAFARALPVPDATLGAVAYAVEAVLAVLGGANRSRTSPRLVITYGVVLAGLALTGLALVLTQIVVIRALCTLCLGSALISWITLLIGRGEVLTAFGTLKGTIFGGHAQHHERIAS